MLTARVSLRVHPKTLIFEEKPVELLRLISFNFLTAFSDIHYLIMGSRSY